MKKSAIVLVALLFSLAAIDARGAAQYAVTDLGTLGGGNGSSALAINNSGQVVGWSFVKSDSQMHAFLYSNGTMTALGSSVSDAYNSRAFGINSVGQVVGSYQVTYNGYKHPFIYDINTGQMVDPSYCSPFIGTGYGINDNGSIVGSFSTSVGGIPEHAFLYSGSVTDLGVIGGWQSIAYAVNSSGQAAGVSMTSWSGPSHAFLYANGVMNDLGMPLNCAYSRATDINDSGQVVGYAYDDDSIDDYAEHHSFLYSNSMFTDIGTLGGIATYAYGINESGQVVGRSCIGTTSYTFHAYLYSDGELADLNDLIDPDCNWELGTATAINDSGQIVGCGRNPAGQDHAYLLTPIPEPTSIALLVTFTLALGIRQFVRPRWRHRLRPCFECDRLRQEGERC